MSDPMTNSDIVGTLERVGELAEKATPGPWEHMKQSCVGAFGTFYYLGECYGDNELRTANAEYIAAANPETVLQLLALISAQEAEIKRLESIVYPGPDPAEHWDSFSYTVRKGETEEFAFRRAANDQIARERLSRQEAYSCANREKARAEAAEAALLGKEEEIKGLREHRQKMSEFMSELAEYMGVPDPAKIPDDFIASAKHTRQWCADKQDEVGHLQSQASSISRLVEAARPLARIGELIERAIAAGAVPPLNITQYGQYFRALSTALAELGSALSGSRGSGGGSA